METAKALIQTGSVGSINHLTRNLCDNTDLRTQLAAESSVWQDLAAKIKSISNENASMNGSNTTPAITAILQLTNNMSATSISGKMALQSNFIREIVSVELPTSHHRLVCQIMANLSMGFNCDMHSEIEYLLNQGLESSSIDYFDVSDDTSATYPLMIMHKNIARSLKSWNSESTEKLLKLWDSILNNISQWFNAPERHKMLIRETMELAVITFANGIYGSLMEQYSSSPHLSYPLYKIFGSLIEDVANDEEQKEEFKTSKDIEGSTQITVELLERGLSAFTEVVLENQYTEHILLGLNVIELLRIFTSMTKVSPGVVIPQYRHILLKPLIFCLRATKNLPAKSKLNVNDDSQLLPRDFPHLKCLLISALTDLVAGNQKAQDVMREEGGLPAVLECCVIDGNNPFMKEHAILCIRYLLENNLDNQNFVEKMEAKQSYNPEVLAQAGYETEIVNGKINIKKTS